MTLDSASSTGTGEPDIKETEKNPEIKVEGDEVDREWSWMRESYQHECGAKSIATVSVKKGK